MDVMYVLPFCTLWMSLLQKQNVYNTLSFGKGVLVILWNEHIYNFYVLSNEGYWKLRDNFDKVK
ncbi:hypothetical protein B4168_1792 [Anoxybacillus flavithermus]|nr:hypothetical protein B4168_1792 [Anoxybacillus flavithermus]OAO84730.1 hypothetical protein GT23_3335 [Parageobacillus thermoglucosidasius]